MTTINLDLPDTILESYQQNLPSLSHDIKQAFIIWEYLSGHLSLRQSADALSLSITHKYVSCLKSIYYAYIYRS